MVIFKGLCSLRKIQRKETRWKEIENCEKFEKIWYKLQLQPLAS